MLSRDELRRREYCARINRVIDYVQSHLDGDLALARLAREAGFSAFHFHRVFQVVSEYGYCRTRFKLDETLMIVVLRKLYEEQAEQLRLAADPVVTVGEAREEYRTITGKERDLGVVQYEQILRRLRKLGLIDTLDGRSIDVRNSEARLRLRGSLKMILPVQTADEMEAWVRRYRVSGDGGGGDAEDED